MTGDGLGHGHPRWGAERILTSSSGTFTPEDGGSLAQPSKGLQQARRYLADRMAAQLIAEPERLIPDAGLMSMLASVEASIAAVEAVLAEDQGGGE